MAAPAVNMQEAGLAGVKLAVERAVPTREHLPPLCNLVDDETWCTHTSLHSAIHDSFERPEGLKVFDYERLEHVGDIVLGYHVTRMIDEHYPRLVVGIRSLLRSILVANTTLSTLSQALGFPSRLRAAEAQLSHLSTNHIVQAAMFEAHVAALERERGPQEVHQFLTILFTPLLQAAYTELFHLYQLSPSASSSALPAPSSPANAAVNYVGKIMEWVDDKGRRARRSATFIKLEQESVSHPPKFSFQLVFQDLGSAAFASGATVQGTGWTVKAAKAMAAREACERLGI